MSCCRGKRTPSPWPISFIIGAQRSVMFAPLRRPPACTSGPMARAEVAVIDYGVGNLLSVRRALEHCGVTVSVTAEPEVILAAARVVLPGVGAFANGMGQLRHSRLDIVAQEVAARGIPLLGICLGMQMLLDER